VHGVYDRARSVSCKPKYAGTSVAFSSTARDRHLEVRPISRLNTQPMVSPVNASRLPSRAAAHHSGSRLLAKLYRIEDFHLLSFASLSWRTPDWVVLGQSKLGGTTVRCQIERSLHWWQPVRPGSADSCRLPSAALSGYTQAKADITEISFSRRVTSSTAVKPWTELD
jgi:hypothetical protein